jgi:intergrase/recombinase
MDKVINFLNEYGLLSAIITGLASALGVLLKKVYDRTLGAYLKDKVKRNVAAQVVKYVEQVYKDLHGEDKLAKALEAAAEMLNEKGITISELELRVLLEAALAELNDAFKKTDGIKEGTELYEAELHEAEVEVILPEG